MIGHRQCNFQLKILADCFTPNSLILLSPDVLFFLPKTVPEPVSEPAGFLTELKCEGMKLVEVRRRNERSMSSLHND